MAKLSKKAQKAKRSEAARKGWETRKARELEEERKRLRAKREREKRKRERDKKRKPEKPKRKPEKPKRKPEKPKRKPEKPKYPFPWMQNLDEQRPKLFPWINSGETVKEQIERWDLFELCFNAVQRGGNSMLLVQQMFPEYTLRELYSIGYGSP